MKRRTESLVIKYYKGNMNEDVQNYFKILLMVYTPWRNEKEDLSNIAIEDVLLEKREYSMAARNEYRLTSDETL